MLYGTGEYKYELVQGWAQYPKEWWTNEAPGLAIDSQDRLYAVTRGTPSVLIFNSDGNLLNSWGEGLFTNAHGICVGSDGSVYCADDGNHTIRKFTTEGKLLMTLGEKDKPSNSGYVKGAESHASVASIKRAAPPFNRPTGVALSSSGEIFVSDGYGNARVHKFDPAGNLILSWGEPGGGPGQFRLPHRVTVDKHDRVWICDRANDRVQIFDAEGKFLDEWTGLVGACDLTFDREGNVYVTGIEGFWLIDIEGNLLMRWAGDRDDNEARLFSGHSVAVDSRGDVYFGQQPHVTAGAGGVVILKEIDTNFRSIQKFSKVKI